MWINITRFISVRCFTSRQPPRIHPPQRVRRILVKVYPPRQAYRVLLRKPSAVRVIIPEQILVQPCITIQVLPLHTQVLGIS